MKKQRSFCQLFYHLVMPTKHRLPLILTREDGVRLIGYIVRIARDIDVQVLEAGFWRDHMHLLVRCPSTLSLTDIYCQLKEFSASAWRNETPTRPFKWADGVYASTVDPDNTGTIGRYIKGQWDKHESHLKGLRPLA